jgi:putative hydrolases of HD superfamily
LDSARLKQQATFLVELDKLKTIYRNSYLTADASRREDDAEHSWHISLMAIILREHCPFVIDINRVIYLLLIHDIVEIDAGDISVFHNTNPQNKLEKEQNAAERIFSLLPDDQKQPMLNAWHEFEAGVTSESRYANIMDRMEPLLQNYYTQGKRWQKDQITYDQVMQVNRKIGDVSPQLWEYAQQLINDSLTKGYLQKSY